MVDISSTKGTTLAPSGAIQTSDRVPARKQGGVETAIHADAAQHRVQQFCQTFSRFLQVELINIKMNYIEKYMYIYTLKIIIPFFLLLRCSIPCIWAPRNPRNRASPKFPSPPAK